MNKYTVTEKRWIDCDMLRSLCIKNGWFNKGTNEQYTKLFEMADDCCDNVKTENLFELAMYIVEHTRFNCIYDDFDSLVCNVMHCIANDACYTCFYSL